MGKLAEPSGRRLAGLLSQWSALVGLLGALLLLGITPASDALAATFTVTQTTDAADANVGDGICDADAVTAGNQCSLRAAVQTANFLTGSHIISLPAGTYTLSVGGPVASNARSEDAAVKGDLDIVSGASIVIRSADTAIGTVSINGGALDRVFDVRSGGALTLVGITVTNGNPGSSAGGGITSSGTLSLIGTTVTANATTGGGGGFYVSSGTATMDASTVSGNTGAPAGGIQVLTGTTLTVRNSVVSGNTGTNGGGLRINGTATITDSTIRGNTATSGAGINVQDSGVLNLTRSTISGNITGGGLRISKASALTTTSTLTNVTISGNDNGAVSGSGIMVVGNNPGAAVVNLTNVTIAANTGGSFPGVSVNVTAGSPGSVTLNAKNSIFEGACGNAGSLSMTLNDQGGNVHTTGNGCAGVDASTNGLVLSALADNGGFTETVAAGATSDALDIAAACPTTDQRGLPRAGQGAGCDAGAYEWKTAGNGPPVLSPIPNQALDEDIPTGPIAIMVADSDTPISSATLTPSISGNTSTVIPTGSFTFQGTGGVRALFGAPNSHESGSGTVTVQVSDGTDIATDPSAFTLAISAVNDAPVFNLVGGNPPAVDAGTDAQTVADFASGRAVGPATAVTFDEGGQSLTGFVVSATGTTGSLTFTTAPAINTATGTLTYQPSPSTSGTASFSVTLSDDGGTTNGGQPTSPAQVFTITVNTLNVAPVNTVPGAQTTPANTPRVFSAANGNAISVADVDAGSSNVQVTLGLTNGTLSLGSTGGLSVSGNGSGTLSATGTLSNLNAALNGLSFTPSSGFSGSVTLTMTTSDLGNTGSGGPLQDQDTVQIAVTSLTTISINDVVATEGNGGVSNSVAFTVTLSGASALPASVSYTTANGSGANAATGGTCGTPGVDFETTRGVLSFNPGVVSQPIAVPICGDTLFEANETLLLNLSAPTNAVLTDGQGIETIQNDDSTPISCAPRPPVRIASESTGDGRLRVTVTADTSGPNGANRLSEIRFETGTNALVSVASEKGRAAPFMLPLSDRPTSVTFFVQRVAPARATTLAFSAVDDCGAWTTFVGDGPASP